MSDKREQWMMSGKQRATGHKIQPAARQVIRNFKGGARRIVGLWVLVGLLLVLASCLLASTTNPPEPSGTLRWSLEGVADLTSLDPALPADLQSNTVINLVFGGLVRIDQNLRVRPDGAEKWRISADGKTYTFTIRADLKFGDGTAVTAEDFLYSINRALAPETASYGAPELLKHITGATDVINGVKPTASGVRALDDRTLEIQLNEPLAYFLSELTYPHTFVVSRTLIEKHGDKWMEHAYGTGPFRVVEWRHNQYIKLQANPFYWRGNLGIAAIEIPFLPSITESYELYSQGELDIIGNIQTGLSSVQVNKMRGSPDLRTVNALSVRYVGFNNRMAPFDNADVRRAFALAVDKDALTQQILAGRVKPTDRILPAGMPGSSLPINGETFDPIAARAALGFAGYPSGQALSEITLTYSKDGENAAVAHFLQQSWYDTLRVNVVLEGLPLVEFIRRLDQTYREPATGLDMYLSIWGADYPDPQNFLSQQLRTNSPFNNGHWSSPEFDELVRQADQMVEQTQYRERLSLYNQAEQIAVSEVGWLPLYNPQSSILIRPTVQGLVLTPQGIIAPNWTQVRIEEHT
ncbi:MAG: peptide ABC transporter substrate-binding protein [Chloroflexales bacterium]|nr:peptide ABC transporter substrate-binding protein [Chloroflexales bacterium]